MKLPVVAFGVGVEYNEELLSLISDATAGAYYHLTDLDEFEHELGVQLLTATRESIQDMEAAIHMPRGVSLLNIKRIYPSLFNVEERGGRYFFGNQPYDKDSVFIFELRLPARPPGKFRIMDLTLSFKIAGQKSITRELSLFVEYTNDKAETEYVNPDVMHYVQQRNIQAMLDQATKEAKTDPHKAQEMLDRVQEWSKTVGNHALGKTVRMAIKTLKTERRLIPNLTKQLVSDGRTKTVPNRLRKTVGCSDKTTINPKVGLSDEEIRKLTGR